MPSFSKTVRQAVRGRDPLPESMGAECRTAGKTILSQRKGSQYSLRLRQRTGHHRYRGSVSQLSASQQAGGRIASVCPGRARRDGKALLHFRDSSRHRRRYRFGIIGSAKRGIRSAVRLPTWEERKMDVDLIFKIAAIGIIVAVLNQVLIRSGREEQAMLTTLAGLIVVLTIIIQEISDLFHVVKSVFGL